jgi:hypothetical protein
VLALGPKRQFAVGVFTNARPGGEQLHYEISTWALAEFAALSQALPPTYDLTAARLAEYVGRYGVNVHVPGGGGDAQVVEVTADGGGLSVTVFSGDVSAGVRASRRDWIDRRVNASVSGRLCPTLGLTDLGWALPQQPQEPTDARVRSATILRSASSFSSSAPPAASLDERAPPAPTR